MRKRLLCMEIVGVKNRGRHEILFDSRFRKRKIRLKLVSWRLLVGLGSSFVTAANSKAHVPDTCTKTSLLIFGRKSYELMNQVLA